MRSPCDDAVILSAPPTVPCRSDAQPWILAATILGSSMAFIDGTVVNVALPALQTSFHATVVGVQWVVESYGLFLSALILAGGALGDLYGRRRMFLAGVVTFAAASAACGLATSIEQLIIARSVQGLGAAFLVPGSLAIISASFDEESRGQAIGTWSGFTAITTARGPLLGGWLIEHASWRWVFFLNLPMAVAVVALSAWYVPESRRAGASTVDWTGAALATLGFGGVVYALLESQTMGWGHPVVLGCLIGGLVALVLFATVEEKSASPMVPLQLFKSRNFTATNLVTLLLYAGIGVFFFVFPMNLIQVQGYSTTTAGAAGLPMILLISGLSRWSGGLVRRYGARKPLIAGPLIAALGFTLFAIPSAGGNYWTTFFPAFVVLGMGLAVTVAPLTTVVMNSVDRDHVGTASGINNAVARLAGVLAIAVLGIVLVSAFRDRLHVELVNLAVPANVVQKLEANAIRLAGAEVPGGLDAKSTAAVRAAIADAFVHGFRVLMMICAGLAAFSSGVAWRLVVT